MYNVNFCGWAYATHNFNLLQVTVLLCGIIVETLWKCWCLKWDIVMRDSLLEAAVVVVSTMYLPFLGKKL